MNQSEDRSENNARGLERESSPRPPDSLVSEHFSSKPQTPDFTLTGLTSCIHIETRGTEHVITVHISFLVTSADTAGDVEGLSNRVDLSG